MVPLQSDFDHGTQSHVLTCFMFPQQPPAEEGLIFVSLDYLSNKIFGTSDENCVIAFHSLLSYVSFFLSSTSYFPTHCLCVCSCVCFSSLPSFLPPSLSPSLPCSLPSIFKNPSFPSFFLCPYDAFLLVASPVHFLFVFLLSFPPSLCSFVYF